MSVAWSHWRAGWCSPSYIPWGELGVEIFFVISGFLITGILLDNRSETAGIFVLRQFYARRFLRIFPLFYATIIIALIWNASSMRETWLWHVSYLSNVYFYVWGWHGQLSHFWSLAVEEQFYLLWPLFMIFLPKRFILPVILIGILIAPTFELGMNLLYPAHMSASVLMPSCLDALGMGALLAYAARENFSMQRFTLLLLLIGITGYALCGFSIKFAPVGRLAEDCILGWVVFSAAAGFQGPFGWLLECGPLNYLGKISYGFYVFHNFAISMCLHLIALLGSPEWLVAIYKIPVFRMLIFAGLTIGLAAYSWHRFEKPINDLKRKFPYRGQGRVTVNPPQTGIPDPSG